MSAFTPGPWAVEADAHEFVITSAERPFIATVHSGKHYTTEGNARLIASAPDLLEIVQTFDNYMFLAGEDAEQDSNNPIRALRWKAQQVIARAQGAGA